MNLILQAPITHNSHWEGSVGGGTHTRIRHQSEIAEQRSEKRNEEATTYNKRTIRRIRLLLSVLASEP